MLERLTFTNLNFESIDFNLDLLTAGPLDWKLPVKVFETSADIRRTERVKPQYPGVFRSPTYVGKSTLHLEGDLIADTVEEANQRRLEFFRVLFGDHPALFPPLRRMGDLEMDLMGWGEVLHSSDGVGLDGWPQFHLSTANPTVVPYMITFVIFNGYWTGMSSGAGYYM
jgi:hypothetical protein